MFGKRPEGGERPKGEGDSLRQDLGNSPEISSETRIAKLTLRILESLEKTLGELDVGTINHSFGTAVLALVLIKLLIGDSAGEVREAQAVTTGGQQSEVPETSDEKIKKFWSRLNEYLQKVASTSKIEVSTTPESGVLELWNVLLRYLPLFLLFLLLHDYGKRFISDIVNSELKFSKDQKALARQVLLYESSNREPLNRQFLPSSPDEPNNNLRQQLLNLFGKWTFEAIEAILSARSPKKTNSEEGPASESSGRVSVNLQELLASFKTNLPNLGYDGTVPEDDAEMAFWWLLILSHPTQSFLDVAETIINQLKQDNNLSPEDKAYITAIAVGVIAGHHTPGGDSGYPPVDVLVKVLEHCLNHLGIDSNAEFWSKAKDLMLFAAAFAKIIDVMQARCFDKRLYNQGTDPPLPTELQFGSQTSDTGGEKSQKLMDDFLKFLYDWIRQKAFPGSEKVGFDNHPIVTGYRSLRGAQQILLI